MGTSTGQPASADVPPGWYLAAMGREAHRSSVEVAGVDIAYAVWPAMDGSPAEPTVVLIHGTYANQYWWSHIAGQMSRSRQIAAIDLSGHGDSGHRPDYELSTWAEEVLAVLSVVEPDRRPAHVIGHSLGGVVAAVAATDPASPIRSISMCESIRDPRSSGHPVMVPRDRPIYPDRASALERFRTIPTGLETVPYVVGYVASRSIESVDGGWTWKHDLNVGSGLQPKMPRLDEVIQGVHCPMSQVVGEHGLVDVDDVALMETSGGTMLETIAVPAAGHHLMLEAPQVFASIDRGVHRSVGPRHYEIVDGICCTAYRESRPPPGRCEETR